MFAINDPSPDYLTLTTYNPVAMRFMKDWHEGVQAQGREAKRMQYLGDNRSDRYGTSFLGVAEQKGMVHALLQVSGPLSDSAFNHMRACMTKGFVHVTRIDLQVTCDYERDIWSQSDLWAELQLESPNRSVSYIESKSGPQGSKLATVYYGSRSSDRMVRIYEKLGMADEVLLRFEVEFKGKRAQACVHEMLSGASVKSILWAELLRMPDVHGLRRLYGPCLQSEACDIRVVREPGGTEEWLRTTVIRALDRYLNQHDIDAASMAELFHRVIGPHLPILEDPLTTGPESAKLASKLVE